MSSFENLWHKKRNPYADMPGSPIENYFRFKPYENTMNNFGGLLSALQDVQSAPAAEQEAPAPEPEAPTQPDTLEQDIASLTDEQQWRLLHMPEDAKRKMVEVMLAGGNPKSWQYGGGF